MSKAELQKKFEEVRQSYEPSDHSTLSPYEAKQCVDIAEAYHKSRLKDDLTDEIQMDLFDAEEQLQNLRPSELEDKSWGYEEGVLITGNTAKWLLNKLKTNGS